MPSGALFGSSSALGGGSGGSKHLVEFRAGRMILKDGMMNPDKRKGFIYVYQSDDSLMHFCWKDRTTSVIEDDLIIFPDDCEFLRVAQCTTGRVFVLKFKSSTRKFFFWMQEPKLDKDEEWCRRINEVLNNPPAVGGGRSGSGGAPDGELQNILNNMSQQQLMQLFGGVGQIGGLSSLLGSMSRSSTSQSSRSSSGTPTSSRPPSEAPRAPARPPRATADTTAATTATATVTATAAPTATPVAAATPAAAPTGRAQPSFPRAVHLSDLQKYLSELASPPGEEGSSTDRSSQGEIVDLASVISTADVIATADPHASGLMEHLPPPAADQPQDDIKTTLLSPQFTQAMSLFSNAIASGQLGPIISQFGLGSEAVIAAQNGDMKAFIKALENQEKKSKSQEGDEPKDKGDEDDSMALD